MTVEELEDVECYTAVIFWSNVKNSARAIDYIRKFCNGQHVFIKRSLQRPWICEPPEKTDPDKEKEAKET